MNVCYRHEFGPTGRFAKLRKGTFIKHILADPALHGEFMSKKASYNKAMSTVSLNPLPSSSMSRGSHISLQEQQSVISRSGAYDWYPLDVYAACFGSVDSAASRGHVAMPHKGVNGIAVFEKPAGVIRVIPCAA